MLPPASGKVSPLGEDKDYVFEDDVRLPLKLEEVLGRGSSAVVERVRDTNTGRVFALKKFTFARPRARALKEDDFKREAAITRRLAGHHHFIRIYATFVARLKLGLILEPAADEGNLEQYLGAYRDTVEGRQSSGADVKVMTMVLERAFGCLANGLAFMHSQDIRHKDIKPQNILVYRGTVIYGDFGCAKDGKESGSNSTEGPTEFSRRYAPPEVLAFDRRNSKADVYCLGCVFVEVLATVSQKHTYKPELVFSHSMDEIHGALASTSFTSKLSFLPSLIISMTCKDPKQRPKAEAVSAKMPANEGFFCFKCSHKHPASANSTSEGSASNRRDSILEVTAPLSWAREVYFAKIAEVERLRESFDRIRKNNASNIVWQEGGEALFADGLGTSDLDLAAPTNDYFNILHQLSACEARAQQLKLAATAGIREIPALALARQNSDAVHDFAAAQPCSASIRPTQTKSAVCLVENDPTEKESIQEWSLIYLKSSAIQKCMYLNALEDRELANLADDDWKARATRFWNSDSMNESEERSERYETSTTSSISSPSPSLAQHHQLDDTGNKTGNPIAATPNIEATPYLVESAITPDAQPTPGRRKSSNSWLGWLRGSKNKRSKSTPSIAMHRPGVHARKQSVA